MKLKNLLLTAFSICSLAVSPSFCKEPVTAISTDITPLNEAIVMMKPVNIGKGHIISGFLGKMLNIPKTTKIADSGFLAFGLSEDAIQVMPTEEKSLHIKSILPYLNESKELQDSLKLRRTARQIRYQHLKDKISKSTELSEEQKESIIDFLSQSIGSPVVLLSKSPLPYFMPSPGPCMIPLGAERLDSKGKTSEGIETSVICLLDIKSGNEVIFSIEDALKNDTLDLVICHENAHAIQFDMYGKLFQKIQRTSTNGHDAPYITDLGLAYIEGWAEAFEAVYGPANPKLDEKDRTKYNISEFLYSRQNPVRRDRYVWVSLNEKTGELKNGLQLMSTEGVIAGFFYDILTSRAIVAPFDKCVKTMLETPMNFMEFVKTYVKLFPEDKKVIYRIILENSHYVTMHENAYESYKNYYGFVKAYKQKKIEKNDFVEAKKAYKEYTEKLFEEAMKTDNIFANVGPQMWFSGKVDMISVHKIPSERKELMAEAFGKKDKFYEFRLDLNTASKDMLRSIGFSYDDVNTILKARTKKNFFTGNPINVLKNVLGEEKFNSYNQNLNLAPYDHSKSDSIRDYEEQSVVLWPEDIAKLRQIR